MARIIDLADILGALSDSDMLAVSDISANQDKKLAALALKNYVLSGKALGGTAVDDITVNNAVQTLRSKTLLTPKINSNNTTEVTSEDLNKLHAVTVPAAAINYLHGANSNLQTQLNNKADLAALVNVPKFLAVPAVASTNEITITESDIRAQLGLGGTRRISSNVSVQVHETSSNPGRVTDILSNLRIYRSTLNSSYLSSIVLTSAVVGSTYVFLITCYDVYYGGDYS